MIFFLKLLWKWEEQQEKVAKDDFYDVTLMAINTFKD